MMKLISTRASYAGREKLETVSRRLTPQSGAEKLIILRSNESLARCGGFLKVAAAVRGGAPKSFEMLAFVVMYTKHGTEMEF